MSLVLALFPAQDLVLPTVSTDLQARRVLVWSYGVDLDVLGKVWCMGKNLVYGAELSAWSRV